jgi:beta-phosphoglucomutase family hydrolase
VTTRGKPGTPNTGPVTIDPRRYDGVLFDLDGVVTDTASVHAAAWAALFDDYLSRRAHHEHEDHSPLTDADYRHFIDGKPRQDGIRDFLAARSITLPQGDGSDRDGDTIAGLGYRVQSIFRRMLADGITVFESTVTLVRRLQEAGIATAVYSSSRNCRPVLQAAGLDELFTVVVDGVVADELGLPGKPDPAVPIEAAKRLGVRPDRCVVVDDAESGVAAGRNGGFAFVIGVARSGHGDDLLAHGADAVVADLADVAVSTT